MKKYPIHKIEDQYPITRRIVNEIVKAGYVRPMDVDGEPCITEEDCKLMKEMAWYMAGKRVVSVNGENRLEKLTVHQAYEVAVVNLYGEEKAWEILLGETSETSTDE
jgi:uncharacterized protein (UPF0218 family)